MDYKKILKLTVLLATLLVPALATSQDNLLIIAPDEFINELVPLKRFKDASGRPTYILSLTQVYDNPSFNGADEAEEVKRCIAYYEEHHHVDFVMLVGDIENFPARFRFWGWIKSPALNDDQRGWAVSDLYFADLYKDGTRDFDDWDANKNGLYGEIQFDNPTYCDQANYGCTINQDDIDFLPDVAVGRIPASTPQEVAAYVNKVISYELKTMPTDQWFRQVALYTGTWISSDDAVKNYIGNLFPPDFQLIKRYHGTNTATPAQIISDLNNGVGFVNYMGHGTWRSWACVGFDWNYITSLNNSDQLPVVFAAACDTGMFALQAGPEPYIDTGGGEHCGFLNGEEIFIDDFPPYPNVPRPAVVQDDGADGDDKIDCPLPGDTCPPNGCVCTNCQYDQACIAECFLFGRKPGDPPSTNGAIAYLGERTGAQGTIVDLDKYFFEAYNQGDIILGDMWRYIIEQYYDFYNLSTYDTLSLGWEDWRIGHRFDEPQKLILFGDPSLVVGGAFTNTLSGSVYDGNGGPLITWSRHRVIDNIIIPAGEKLTVLQGASVLFENGKNITAIDINPTNGFIVDGYSTTPVCFMSLAPDPQPQHAVRGMKVYGQLRMRNGGQIKFF